MQNPIKALFPQTIATYQSDINGKITVSKLFGKLSLNVGHLAQSSQLVQDIWEKVIQEIAHTHTPEDVLILGLAGGSMLKPLKEAWPDAKITAVEIDPIMIDIGKTHFDLDAYIHLNIIEQDAQDFVTNSKKKYELILIDLYTGRDLPKFVTSEEFINSLRQTTTKGGINIFNRVSLKGQEAEVAELKSVLETHYTKVNQIKTPANKLFACQLN